MESTIQLFSHLVDNLPPLLPDDLVYRIRKELKNIQSEPIGIDKLEEKMIRIGYEIWPWNQAFREFLRSTEEKMGEDFLVAHLNEDLQKRYHEYREMGMTWRDVHSDRTAVYFDEKDRLEVSISLMATHRAVKDFAIREMVGLKKEKYLNKVEDLKKVLLKIQDSLNRLRELGEAEYDHPMLSGEIKERVRTFEHGLCLLAPEFDHEEISRSHEFFVGRKQELNRLRGIHESIEIDFYS